MSSAEQPTVVVTIGEIDVSEAIVKLNTSIATSQEGTATLFLNSAYPTLNDIDYTNLVTISAARGGTLHPIFTGDVASVHVSDEDQLVVECANMTAFREIALGHLEGKNCAADIVYSLARSAGLDDARIKMEGYGTPPLEEFQVVAPINGIDLQKEVRVSGILFRPARVGLPEICSQFDLTGEALDFTQGSAFAIALVPARKLHDAQEIGLAAIDDALSWLVVRSRYSSSVGPDGSLTSWSRSQMRFSPVRGRLVCVAGLTTTRAWLRSAEDTPILSALGMLDGAPIKQMDDSLALAFASCRRAAIADRYIERVAAIWEAVEYFV